MDLATHTTADIPTMVTVDTMAIHMATTVPTLLLTVTIPTQLQLLFLTTK